MKFAPLLFCLVAWHVKHERHKEEMMSEQEQVTEQPAPTDTAVSPSPETLKPEPAADAKTVPYDRFQEVNKQLKQLLADQEKTKKAQVEAERVALEQQNEFKKLYEQEKARATQIETERQQLLMDALRKEAAAAANIPSLWNRLQGTTKEEIEADAVALAESLPKPAAPNLDGGANMSRGNGNQPTPQQIKEMAARYRVSPELLAQQYGVTLAK